MAVISPLRKAIDDQYLVRRKLLEYVYRAPVVASSATIETIGMNVFSRDWDLLVILDTCRVDGLNALVPEYDFLTKNEGI